MWNVVFFSKNHANGPSRSIGNHRQNRQPRSGSSKQQLSAGFDRSSELVTLHFTSFCMPLIWLPVLVWSGVQVQVCPADSILSGEPRSGIQPDFSNRLASTFSFLKKIQGPSFLSMKTVSEYTRPLRVPTLASKFLPSIATHHANLLT